MVRSLAVLLSCQLVGEGVSALLRIPIPGPVIGMVLLTAALKLGVLRLEWVEEGARLLLDNLALLFVPAGTGLMLYFGLLGREWPGLLAAVAGGTLVVLGAVGVVAQALERPWKRS